MSLIRARFWAFYLQVSNRIPEPRTMEGLTLAFESLMAKFSWIAACSDGEQVRCVGLEVSGLPSWWRISTKPPHLGAYSDHGCAATSQELERRPRSSLSEHTWYIFQKAREGEGPCVSGPATRFSSGSEDCNVTGNEKRCAPSVVTWHDPCHLGRLPSRFGLGVTALGWESPESFQRDSAQHHASRPLLRRDTDLQLSSLSAPWIIHAHCPYTLSAT